MEAENERRRADVGAWVRANRTVSAILLLLTLLVAALFFAMWQGRTSGYEAASQSVQLAGQVSNLQAQVSGLNIHVENLQKELEIARNQYKGELGKVVALQAERDALTGKVGVLEKEVTAAHSKSANPRRVVVKRGVYKHPKKPVYRRQVRSGCGAWKCYVVRPGDTPGKIAAKMYPRAKHPERRWVALLEANGVSATLENARKLRVGKRLVVPTPKVADNLTRVWHQRNVAGGVQKVGAADVGGQSTLLASGVNISPGVASVGQTFLTDPEASRGVVGVDRAALWPQDTISPWRTADESQDIRFTGDVLTSLPAAAHRWYGVTDRQRAPRESRPITRDVETHSGHDPP